MDENAKVCWGKEILKNTTIAREERIRNERSKQLV